MIAAFVCTVPTTAPYDQTKGAEAAGRSQGGSCIRCASYLPGRWVIHAEVRTLIRGQAAAYAELRSIQDDGPIGAVLAGGCGISRWGRYGVGLRTGGVVSVLPYAIFDLLRGEGGLLQSKLVGALEGGGGHHRVGETGQGIDFLVDVLSAVAGVGVVGQDLCSAGAVFSLDDFEELRQPTRIVTGVVQNVGSQQVGLFFVVSRHAQAVKASSSADDSLGCLSCGAIAEEDAGGELTEAGHDVGGLLLLHVAGGMAQHYVGRFMGENPGELGFGFGGLDGSQIDEDGSAGEGERVDVGAGDDVEGIGPLEARSVGDQVGAELGHVERNRVGFREDRHLPVDLGCHLGTFSHLLLRGEGVVAGGWRVVGGERAGTGCAKGHGQQAEFQDVFARANAHGVTRIELHGRTAPCCLPPLRSQPAVG